MNAAEKAIRQDERRRAWRDFEDGLHSFDGGEVHLTERAAPEVNGVHLEAVWRFCGEQERFSCLVADEVRAGEPDRLRPVKERIARELVAHVTPRLFKVRPLRRRQET